LTGIPAPETTEALVGRRALSVFKERGFQKLILVSDYLSLIQWISSTSRDRSTLGIIVGDIKSLKTDFESCIFRFSSRKLNMVAHKLARSAEPSVCKISIDVILKFIWVELCNDVV
jgi:hypothetical protein